MDKIIFLYGPPGSGKSIVGRKLAQALRRPFWDLDEVIEMGAGQSIPEIFAREGEAGFRLREFQALHEISRQPPGVVALGGGALLSPKARSLAESRGRVLCLSAPQETLLNRLRFSAVERPLLTNDDQMLDEDRLVKLIHARSAHYASFAVQLDTESLSPEEAAWEAQALLGCFHVSAMGTGYDVWVEPGGLNAVGALLSRRGLKGPVVVVTDENVAPVYLQCVIESLTGAGYSATSVVLPAGEVFKNMASVERIWEALIKAGVDRGSTLAALGGGVINDLAGFAAAVYLRGLRWVALPTSLLAMCDASLGGKTGVDLSQGKNLVGAFHPPAFVLADPQALATLPEEELRNGMAEVVKHGVIADAALFSICSQGWNAVMDRIEEVVRRSMAVKVRVIEEDPFEKGARATLNLGHTLGHALEQASGYRMMHGEGVAIGMVASARYAESIGLAEGGMTERLRAALLGLGLPVEPPMRLDKQAVIQAMRLDKKRADGRIKLVLPCKIGKAIFGVDLDDASRLIDTVWREKP